MPYQTVNPYTGKLVASYEYATDQEIDATIEKAHEAFLSWRTAGFGDRAKILTRAAELLRADKRAFAEVLTLEMGKIIPEAEAEVELSAEILDYFAAHGEGFLTDEPLGVKDPVEGTVTIVLDDADIDKTVAWAVFGRHWNAGQVCVSAKRLIIADAVYDEFMEKYRDGVAALQAGDPRDPATQLAPLSTQKAADNLAAVVTAAIEGGATEETLGQPVPAQGAFFQPMILTNVSPDNPGFQTEFFGPVSMVFRVADEDEAVAVANASRYGLGGSVFSRNTVRGERVARRIETGMVFVNHPTAVKADIPFGGVKVSGYGNELTEFGIREFVTNKVIDVVDVDAPF